MRGIWIGFVGMSNQHGEAARRFEDDVLALLPRHGARVHFRGHRQAGEASDAPAELHVLWFPSEESFAAYLADPDRAAVLARHGEVFDAKIVVRLDPLVVDVASSPESVERVTGIEPA